MKVEVIRKTKFDKLMVDNNINDQNVESFTDTAFISILNSEATGHFKTNHANVLVLNFDDVTDDLNWDDDDPDFYGPVLFTVEQAKQILEFIELNKDKQQFIVHCSAGISRSGAVGTFINDYFGLDYSTFRRTNPQVQPNPFVLRTLRNIS